MPRIPKEQTEENQRRIESAALELFTTQGFHGTSSREIADRIGMSAGAIYTYFPSKEAIFSGLAEKYQSRLGEWLSQTFQGLKEPLSKKDLQKLASAIKTRMYDDPQFFL